MMNTTDYGFFENPSLPPVTPYEWLENISILPGTTEHGTQSTENQVQTTAYGTQGDGGISLETVSYGVQSNSSGGTVTNHGTQDTTNVASGSTSIEEVANLLLYQNEFWPVYFDLLGSQTLTYSFPTKEEWEKITYYADNSREKLGAFKQFTEVQQKAVEQILQIYSNFIGITFVKAETIEAKDSGRYLFEGQGYLIFANNSSVDSLGSEGRVVYGYAYASYLYSDDSRTAQEQLGQYGDVWLNYARSTNSESAWAPGSSNYKTLVHEIGHALGLHHSFADKGDTGSYVDDVASYMNHYLYTVMAYESSSKDADKGFVINPISPMPLDILALQSLYGPSTKSSISYPLPENGPYLFSSLIPSTSAYLHLPGTTADWTVNLQRQEITEINASTKPGISASDGSKIWNFASLDDVILGSGNDTINVYDTSNSHAHLNGGAGGDVYYFSTPSLSQNAQYFIQDASGSDTIKSDKKLESAWLDGDNLVLNMETGASIVIDHYADNRIEIFMTTDRSQIVTLIGVASQLSSGEIEISDFS
jgi:hypothetical protein